MASLHNTDLVLCERFKIKHKNEDTLEDEGDQKASTTFFLNIVLGGSLAEVVAGEEQHATHQICSRDSSRAADFPEEETKWRV